MTVEVDVAVLAQRVADHHRIHGEAAADRERLWAQIEASRTAREDTNRRLTAVEVGQAALRVEVETMGALIRGDMRRVLAGGAVALAILVGLLIISLTRGPAAVGAVVAPAVGHALPGGAP
jgi:hypothetical protein